MTGTPDEVNTPRYSRRRFLGAAGAAALGAATFGRPAFGRTSETTADAMVSSDRFSRMFPHLPPFAEATPAVRDALRAIGAPGGLLDAHDFDLPPGSNPDNPNLPAGMTFVGQFIDHDVTLDLTSTLGVPTTPERTRNFREPALNLDSVYGVGFGNAALVLPNGRMRIEQLASTGPSFEDLPRTTDGTAIIGDPRNDENMMIAGLHAAVLRFHNQALDLVSTRSRPGARARFAAARRLTRWHYQWIVLHEFLPLLVGSEVVEDIRRRGRRFYTERIAGSMPVEFQIAYRMGHSLTRPAYRVNLHGNDGASFFVRLFDPSQDGVADPNDLRGGHRAPRRFIDWELFFPFPGFEPSLQQTKRIDRTISTPLFELPMSAIPTGDAPTALPQRTLLRHLTWQLPSGQEIAGAMSAPVLGAADLDELSALGVGFERSTPLWYYVLAEAELLEDGLRLGPVGGRIVAEVLIGLLETDPSSFLSRLGWRAKLPAPVTGAGDFRITDFLAFAGVDPRSRGSQPVATGRT